MISDKNFPGPQDRAIIVRVYDELDQKLEGVNADSLIERIRGRCWTEWWFFDRVGDITENYRGKAFERWVRRETHYALEKAGYVWQDRLTIPIFTRSDDITRLSAEEYDSIKNRVLEAVVKKAITFFEKCDCYGDPPIGDRENLRSSIKLNM